MPPLLISKEPYVRSSSHSFFFPNKMIVPELLRHFWTPRPPLCPGSQCPRHVATGAKTELGAPSRPGSSAPQVFLICPGGLSAADLVSQQAPCVLGAAPVCRAQRGSPPVLKATDRMLGSPHADTPPATARHRPGTGLAAWRVRRERKLPEGRGAGGRGGGRTSASSSAANCLCDSSVSHSGRRLRLPLPQASVLAQTCNQSRILKIEKAHTALAFPPFLSAAKPPLGVWGVATGGRVLSLKPQLPPPLHSWLGAHPNHPLFFLLLSSNPLMFVLFLCCS